MEIHVCRRLFRNGITFHLTYQASNFIMSNGLPLSSVFALELLITGALLLAFAFR